MIRFDRAFALISGLALLLTAGSAAAQRAAISEESDRPVAERTTPRVSYYDYDDGVAPRSARASTVTYYAPRVSYYESPAVSYYAPGVSYYEAPSVSYAAPDASYSPAPARVVTRYGLFGRPRRTVTYYAR